MSKITVSDLFKKAGINWEVLEPGDLINIEDKNIKVKSLNHESNEIEFKNVISLVRKNDSYVYNIMNDNKKLISCTGAHRLYSYTKQDDSYKYNSVEELPKEFYVLSDDDIDMLVTKVKTNKVEPILDFEVEDNNNYFSNGILSHNTTSGGRALKFFSSVRLEIRLVEMNIKKEGNQDNALGLTSRVKAVKNKVGVPRKKYEIYFDFKKGIESNKEYIDFAVKLGIIDKSGSWYSYGEYKLGQGLDNIAELIMSNKNMFNEIKSKVDAIVFKPKTKEKTEEESAPKRTRKKKENESKEEELQLES